MRPESKEYGCDNPSYFSEVLTPAVERRLPEDGSITRKVVDHVTGIGPFFHNVSEDLCDDGRMSEQSARSAVRFITRSASTALIVGGTATLAAAGLVVGSPLAAVGAGIVGLVLLPPLAERTAFGVIRLGQELLNGVRRGSSD